MTGTVFSKCFFYRIYFDGQNPLRTFVLRASPFLLTICTLAKSSHVYCKKRFAIFPSPAGMSLTKLSLAKNNLIVPGQGQFGDIPAENGKIYNLFYSAGVLSIHLLQTKPNEIQQALEEKQQFVLARSRHFLFKYFHTYTLVYFTYMQSCSFCCET